MNMLDLGDGANLFFQSGTVLAFLHFYCHQLSANLNQGGKYA